MLPGSTRLRAALLTDAAEMMCLWQTLSQEGASASASSGPSWRTTEWAKTGGQAGCSRGSRGPASHWGCPLSPRQAPHPEEASARWPLEDPSSEGSSLDMSSLVGQAHRLVLLSHWTCYEYKSDTNIQTRPTVNVQKNPSSVRANIAYPSKGWKQALLGQVNQKDWPF